MEIIPLITTVIALAALSISVLAVWLASKQTRAAEEQARAAKEQVLAAKEQVLAAKEQVLAAKEQILAAEKSLGLTAYANAIQGGILDLKRTFFESHDIFAEQMKLNPDMQKYIPTDMDIRTFLVFAGGMWRLSYVYSVMDQGEALGLNEDERIGLKKEMLLWLQHVPGFCEVYISHTSKMRAHNPGFLNVPGH